MKLSAAAASAMNDNLVNSLEGGSILVYDGVPPVSVAAVVTGVLLATLPITAGAFAASVNGSSAATAIDADVSADASGTPTYVRILTSGAAQTVQLTAGVGSGEVNFGAPITSGNPVDITSLTIAVPLG